jgi:dUTP pyrophosphatase
MLPVINLGKAPYTIRRGDRIAQMVINRIYQMKTELVRSLDNTDRNTGGFGHTGYR